MASFLTERLPNEISFGSSGGPAYQTTIIERADGREQRNKDWAYSRSTYNVDYGARRLGSMSEFLKYYHASSGRLNGLRFLDLIDNTSAATLDVLPTELDQFVATGDGVQTEFQVIKTYTAGTSSQRRIITRLFIGSLLVAVNGALVTPASINHDLGTFVLPAPAPVGETVTAGYFFDVPTRFDDDNLDTSFNSFDNIGSSIKLTELREGPFARLPAPIVTPTFLTEEFPDCISYGSTSGANYRTSVFGIFSGHENRKRGWDYPRHRYNVTYDSKRLDAMTALVNFFHVTAGRWRTFPFKDELDFTSAADPSIPITELDQLIFTGDGAQTQFQVVKTYEVGADTQRRIITRLIVDTLVVAVGGVLTVPTAININEGTFTLGSAPGVAVPVTAGYEFRTPSRFDNDSLDAAYTAHDNLDASVPLMEVLEGPFAALPV